jgi:NAD(P)-dependent dehydrogenase (short-subunit alcohol dehydrogenase family)
MFCDNLLKGRTILVTGGGTGLGRAMALRFAQLGARLFLVGRREDPLKQTVQDIQAKQGRAAWFSADVRDFTAVEGSLLAAEREFGQPFGGVDTLVNNAAGNFIARTETLSPNAFHAVVGIVLGRRWIAAHQAGTILNIVSTYADANCGSGFIVPSACAKSGVLAMTRSLAVEWARYRIRVNAIAPGLFKTEGAFSRLLPSKDLEEKAKSRSPMKRFGRIEELTNLAAYLISEQADYINGECVVIDGADWPGRAGAFNDLVHLPDSVWERLETSRKK